MKLTVRIYLRRHTRMETGADAAFALLHAAHAISDRFAYEPVRSCEDQPVHDAKGNAVGIWAIEEEAPGGE